MKILLDTHVLLWALTGSRKLSSKTRKMITSGENEVYVSIISPWEVEIKHNKHPDRIPIDSAGLLSYCRAAGYKRLSVRPEHIDRLKELASDIHADPFDRMLICQAQAEDMLLLTCDEKIAAYEDRHIMKV